MNRFYAKYILRLKLPHYCMVNILGKREVFPELIESGLSSNNLLNNFLSLHQEGAKRLACLNGCREIRETLTGNRPPSEKAAEEILGVLSC